MTTMEERMNSLEQEVAGLKAMLGLSKPVKKDWESTVGMFQNDPVFDEVMDLGRQWREAQTYEQEIAGS
ncbi:MAG: hypothetical protein U0984_12020 [Prosthecobacter sp.]|nr:hypothetical protein [Prosthecobacter sp.]